MQFDDFASLCMTFKVKFNIIAKQIKTNMCSISSPCIFKCDILKKQRREKNSFTLYPTLTLLQLFQHHKKDYGQRHSCSKKDNQSKHQASEHCFLIVWWKYKNRNQIDEKCMTEICWSQVIKFSMKYLPFNFAFDPLLSAEAYSTFLT